MKAGRAGWTRTFLGCVALLVAYYAFPVDRWDSPPRIAFELLLTLAGLGLLGWMMVQELIYVRRGELIRSTETLALLLVMLIVFFSLAFFLVNLARPEEFYDLHSRTDALYFTLATMATVGYGDVHAEGQVARAMVCGLIAFDVAVLAALLRGRSSHPPREP